MRQEILALETQAIARVSALRLSLGFQIQEAALAKMFIVPHVQRESIAVTMLPCIAANQVMMLKG